MKRNQIGSVGILSIVLILLVLGLGGFAAWRYFDENKTDTPQTSQQASSADELPEGFVLYENQEAGFSFGYPREWGEVRIEEFDSPSKGDTYLYAIFSNNDNTHFGGDRQDYSHDGRGRVPTDSPGYVKSGLSYLFYSEFGKKGELVEIENASSLEEIEAANTTGLYQKGAVFGDEIESLQQYDIVRYNLDQYPYFGVNFVLSVNESDQEEQKQFIDTVTTFKLL